MADPRTIFETQWNARDGLLTSSRILEPKHDEHDHRRKLLLVYIHGFMGNEASFRGFPAHLHNLLTVILAETHVVHTKLYPEYKSRNNIAVARDNFSRWLVPHESPATDIILLGHSMGGLLSAEVALIFANGRPKHDILGTINFDVPFLGIHPGVVKSGLASIFKPSEETHEDHWADALQEGHDDQSSHSPNKGSSSSEARTRLDELWAPEQVDPNFNPSYTNDVLVAGRKGWHSVWYFVKKHRDNLPEASMRLITSHMEFGGVMANYPEMMDRYTRIRVLEETSARARQRANPDSNLVPPRVRFINYYTACTGRPKPPSHTGSTSSSQLQSSQNSSTSDKFDTSDLLNGNTIEKFKIDDQADQPLSHLDPNPIDEEVDTRTISSNTDATTINSSLDESPLSSSLELNLPTLPPLPPAPEPLTIDPALDKDTRKLLEKEHQHSIKQHERALKDRDRILREREKLLEKRKRQAAKDAEKAARSNTTATTTPSPIPPNPAPDRPPQPLSHAESEARRLEQEKLRMANEARRMRGEPPLDALPTPPPRNPSEPSPPTNPLPTTKSSRPPSPSPPPSYANTTTTLPTSTSSTSTPRPVPTPPKDRKFCMLPPRDAQGQLDPCWVRLYMAGVDEVGAHCGLFFVDERYARLVGDVAGRVEGWVTGGE